MAGAIAASQPASAPPSAFVNQNPNTAEFTSHSAANPPTTTQSHLHVKRRTSKPILAWVRGKLAGGTIKKDGTGPGYGPGSGIPPVPAFTVPGRDAAQARASEADVGPTPFGTAPRMREMGVRTGPRPSTAPSSSSRNGTGGFKKSGNFGSTTDKTSMRRKVVQKAHTPPPLSSTKGFNGTTNTQIVQGSEYSTSLPPSPKSGSIAASIAAPGSTWDPSNPAEADDDASIRPLPPTSPPSPTPSRSTHHTVSSYTSGGNMSDPLTFRSMAASTKPTTLLSIDLGGGAGMAHIAQVAPTPTGHGTAPSSPTFGRFSPVGPRPVGHHGHGHSHSQALSTTSITFSHLPGNRHPLASAQFPDADVDANAEVPAVPLYENSDPANHTQAPNLSHPHPRNNPRPSSPPMDNASVLTLASSAFASPRHQGGAPSIIPASIISLRRFGVEGDDAGASVRAIRPRSRRNSWGSVGSGSTGWSALGPGRRKSMAASMGGVGSASVQFGDGEVDGDGEASVRHVRDERDEDDDATSVELGDDDYEHDAGRTGGQGLASEAQAGRPPTTTAIAEAKDSVANPVDGGTPNGVSDEQTDHKASNHIEAGLPQQQQAKLQLSR